MEIAQIRIFSNLKINIDYLCCHKIELCCDICIREKYGAAEFRFFEFWYRRFNFAFYDLSNRTGWTIHYLCEVNNWKIFQVRSHNLLWYIKYEYVWGYSLYCIVVRLKKSSKKECFTWSHIIWLKRIRKWAISKSIAYYDFMWNIPPSMIFEPSHCEILTIPSVKVNISLQISVISKPSSPITWRICL